MARPIKIWSGTEWVDVAIAVPDTDIYATNSSLSAHESDTTNVHGIADTNELATKSYADNAASTAAANLVDSAPSTLDTLNELAAALGDDANFSTTVTNSIADKVSKSGGDTITVSSGSTIPLTIQNNGTGNSLVINDEDSDSSPIVFDSSGKLGIGTTGPISPLHISTSSSISSDLYTSDYLVISANNTAPGLNIVASGTSGGHRGVFKATRSRGTLDAPEVPLVNDDVFSLLGAIYDGNGNNATAEILMEVDGTVSDGVSPQRIVFSTGQTTSRTERMRISSDGRIKVATGNVLESPVVTNAQTGTSYTLVLADAGKLIELNNAAAITLTVPTNSSVAFPIGTKIDLLQTGAGQVTVGGAGVTINATPGLKLSEQWAAASLVKRATDTWVLIGNLSA